MKNNPSNIKLKSIGKTELGNISVVEFQNDVPLRIHQEIFSIPISTVMEKKKLNIIVQQLNNY